MRRFLGTALLLVMAAACGGDGGTGPPENVDLTGTWSVTMSPIRGYGIDCQITGLQAVIVHTDNILGGTYSATDMVCNGQHSGPLAGQIVEGTAINGNLHFHLDSEDFDLHGAVVSVNQAQGTYTLVLTVNGSVYSFTGSWTARRL